MRSASTILKILIPVLISVSFLPAVSAGLFDIQLDLDVYGTVEENAMLLSDEQLEEYDIDKTDVIFQIRPTIKVGFEGTRSAFLLKYEYFKEWYDNDYIDSNTRTSYHDAYFRGSYELTDRIRLGVFDQYKNSVYGTVRGEVPEIRDDYFKNSLTPSLEYIDAAERFKFNVTGTWSFIDYDDAPITAVSDQSGFADWDEYGAGFAATVQLQTRTDFLFNSSFWNREYDDDSVGYYADQSGYFFGAGVQQKIKEGLTVRAMVTYNHREYDNEIDGSDDAHNGIGGTLAITNQFSGLSRWELEGFSQFDSSERVSAAFYRDSGVRTMFYTVLGEQIESSIDVSYSILDYDNVDEEWKDKYFNAGVKMGYKMYDWLSIRAQYVYSKRTSDNEVNDYDNHMASLYLQFRHNLFY